MRGWSFTPRMATQWFCQDVKRAHRFSGARPPRASVSGRRFSPSTRCLCGARHHRDSRAEEDRDVLAAFERLFCATELPVLPLKRRPRKQVSKWQLGSFWWLLPTLRPSSPWASGRGDTCPLRRHRSTEWGVSPVTGSCAVRARTRVCVCVCVCVCV